MIGYIGLALIKIFDNIIGTAKSIATYKEQKILSSILVVLSQLIFYLIIDRVVNDGTLIIILIVAISSGVGNLLAFIINDKFKKDSKWSMVITSSNKYELEEFCDYLKTKNIKNVVFNGYDKQWQPTYHIIVFSKTKEESRIINKYLEQSNIKYLLEVI